MLGKVGWPGAELGGPINGTGGGIVIPRSRCNDPLFDRRGRARWFSLPGCRPTVPIPSVAGVGGRPAAPGAYGAEQNGGGIAWLGETLAVAMPADPGFAAREKGTTPALRAMSTSPSCQCIASAARQGIPSSKATGAHISDFNLVPMSASSPWEGRPIERTCRPMLSGAYLS